MLQGKMYTLEGQEEFQRRGKYIHILENLYKGHFSVTTTAASAKRRVRSQTKEDEKHFENGSP